VKARRIALLITGATLFYVGMLGYVGILLVRAGGVGPVGLGSGVLLLVPVGVWVVASTLRVGLRHQHLARRLHEEGGLPDTSGLPRRPSGRLDRAVAERLAEYQVAPDDWRTNYRLAIGYDAAGDRGRARETMKRAVALEALDP